VTDTVPADSGLTWWQGSIIGFGVGAAAGAFIGHIREQQQGYVSEDPGLSTFVWMVGGALLGAAIGGSLAQGH
jgi:hypothetical protein